MVRLTLVSGVVSTHGQDVIGGAPLGNFLDHRLDRMKGYVSTKPAFLEDPDLQLPDDASDFFLGLLGRSNDIGFSRPSSTGSEPPDASGEQSCGQDAGDNTPETPKIYTNPNTNDRWTQRNIKTYILMHNSWPGQTAVSNAADNCQGLLSVISQLTATLSASLPSGDITS